MQRKWIYRKVNNLPHIIQLVSKRRKMQTWAIWCQGLWSCTSLRSFWGKCKLDIPSMTLLFQRRFQIFSHLCRSHWDTVFCPLSPPPSSSLCKRHSEIHWALQEANSWRQAVRMTWPRWPFTLGCPSRAEGKQAILPFARLSQIRGLQKNYLGSETRSLWSLKDVGTSPSIMSEKSK